MSTLFSPFQLRSVTLPNRIVVSPMCLYSAVDGFPHEWHLVHLGSRAVGGAGLVFAEATAVLPEARISPQDAGLWSDEHMAAWLPIASFISEQGAVPGIQLAHAGFKASIHRPWDPELGEIPPAEGGWRAYAPGDEPFVPEYPVPTPLDEAGIDRLVQAFADAAHRAVGAGFKVIDVHAAHGYLLHEFLSPLSNRRTDKYGGSAENRLRFPRRVVSAVREAVGPETPVFVRISASDWTEGGLTSDDAVGIALALAAAGADLIDVSSGGVVAKADIPMGPGYQVKFAAQIRAETGLPVSTVGMITEPVQAEQILVTEQADLVFIGRELLRDPYWPLHAAIRLNDRSRRPIPSQYLRAF